MDQINDNTILLVKIRCSELNSRFDKSELNTRNLANLTPDFCYELNSSFFLGKKRWDELNSRIKQANLTPDFWYELNILMKLTRLTKFIN
jgi:hypothetical protein